MVLLVSDIGDWACRPPMTEQARLGGGGVGHCVCKCGGVGHSVCKGGAVWGGWDTVCVSVGQGQRWSEGHSWSSERLGGWVSLGFL